MGDQNPKLCLVRSGQFDHERNSFRQPKQATDNAPYQALATDWFSSARFFSSINPIRLSISLTWA